MTKKLRLSVEDLTVESFTSVPDDGQRGTVAGYATELDTCGGSCFAWCRTEAGPNCPTQKLTGPCGC